MPSAGFVCSKKRPPDVGGRSLQCCHTTIVPAGGDRYIGVNYFSQPSDTLLGILAGLEQIMRADERASPFLAMSQGAHAGRLLLAEYRDDLKKRDI